MTRIVRQFLLFVVLPLLIAGGGTIWLTADLISQLSTGANAEDHKRTLQVVESALNASRQQLADVNADNAHWDDAAQHLYAEIIDPSFVASTWGETSATGVNYDAAFIVDERGKALSSFIRGEPVAGLSMETYFGGKLLSLLQGLPQNASESRSLSDFLATADGAAIVAAGNVAPISPGLKLTVDKPRFLVFVRYLTDSFISSLGEEFVVSGLKFTGGVSARGPYLVRNSVGDIIGAMTWRDRRPGDVTRAAILPAAIMMLLVLIGAMMAIALFSWRQFLVIAARERQASHGARHDPLTGLPNRNALGETLSALLESGNGQVCMVFIDLDGFKDVNDTYDHETGDRLICAVAAGLSCLAGRNASVSRIGGDEFVVLLHGNDPLEDARRFSARVISFLGQPFNLDGRLATVGASIGIAVAAAGSMLPGELLRRADVAMYRAKETGRNRYCVFDAALDADRSETTAIARELRDVLDQGLIECAYQPIIDAETLAITGVEALARWPATSARRIGPDRFIPIAEASGLINRLGQAIMERACADARNWPGLRISINVSPVQLRDPEFARTMLGIIDRHGISRSRIEFEITEGTLIDDVNRLHPVFETLHREGISIALDDFGSGYSSIAYLRALKFDRIKIDKSLTQAMTTSEMARNLIQATGLIARGVNAEMTAEGIESGAEVGLLRLAGCTELQGYYFGRPQTADGISRLLETRNAVAA